MRIRFRRYAPIAVFLSVALALPEPAMACGYTQQNGQQQNNQQDNGRHRHHGGHNRGGNRSNSGIDIGIGLGSIDNADDATPPRVAAPPVAPNLSGPCREAAALRNQLDYLWHMRASIDAGRRLLVANGEGDYRFVNAARFRRQHEQNMALNGASVGQSAADIAELQAALEQRRQNSLRLVDAQITQIQNRLGQLDYECQ